MHHYLEGHTSSDQDVLLHADNAVGQNKNNVVMQYLCWRTITGRNSKMKISFMIPGHTKFSPDHFFGLIRKSYRHTSVSSLPDIEKVVSNSSICGKNIPQVTVDITGKQHVTWYNWNEFHSKYFQRIPNILRYHHFRFDASQPCTVFVKESSISSQIAMKIVNDISI